MSSSPDAGGRGRNVRPPAARPECKGQRTAPWLGASNKQMEMGSSAPARLPMTRCKGPPQSVLPCQGCVALSENRGKAEIVCEPLTFNASGRIKGNVRNHPDS